MKTADANEIDACWADFPQRAWSVDREISSAPHERVSAKTHEEHRILDLLNPTGAAVP